MSPVEIVAKIPPRCRIVTAASDLFYRLGIRAVGVESIAEAARTNKMTLYRHFSSKDELVAEYLRSLAAAADGLWTELETAHPDDPRAQLSGWLKGVACHVTNRNERGCALANAAVEIPEKEHPARKVIEEFKQAQRRKLSTLCAAAALSDPALLADELFLLLEGARVSAQMMGPEGPSARFVHMGEVIIASHAA